MLHNKVPYLSLYWQTECSSALSSTVTFSDFTPAQTQHGHYPFRNNPTKEVFLCEVIGYTSQIQLVQVSAAFSFIYLHCDTGVCSFWFPSAIN